LIKQALAARHDVGALNGSSRLWPALVGRYGEALGLEGPQAIPAPVPVKHNGLNTASGEAAAPLLPRLVGPVMVWWPSRRKFCPLGWWPIRA